MLARRSSFGERRRIAAFCATACTIRKNGRRPQRVMKPAGLLTQGGFYRRFASKDELVAEACREAVSSRTCLIRLRRGGVETDLRGILVALLGERKNKLPHGPAAARLGEDGNFFVWLS